MKRNPKTDSQNRVSRLIAIPLAFQEQLEEHVLEDFATFTAFAEGAARFFIKRYEAGRMPDIPHNPIIRIQRQVALDAPLSARLGEIAAEEHFAYSRVVAGALMAYFKHHFKIEPARR